MFTSSICTFLGNIARLFLLVLMIILICLSTAARTCPCPSSSAICSGIQQRSIAAITWTAGTAASSCQTAVCYCTSSTACSSGRCTSTSSIPGCAASASTSVPAAATACGNTKTQGHQGRRHRICCTAACWTSGGISGVPAIILIDWNYPII